MNEKFNEIAKLLTDKHPYFSLAYQSLGYEYNIKKYSHKLMKYDSDNVLFEITLRWQKTCWKQRNHRFELVLLNSDQTVGKAGNINDEVGGELLKSLQARLSAADTKRSTAHEIAQDNLVNEILSLLQGLK